MECSRVKRKGSMFICLQNTRGSFLIKMDVCLRFVYIHCAYIYVVTFSNSLNVIELFELL